MAILLKLARFRSLASALSSIAHQGSGRLKTSHARPCLTHNILQRWTYATRAFSSKSVGGSRKSSVSVMEGKVTEETSMTLTQEEEEDDDSPEYWAKESLSSANEYANNMLHIIEKKMPASMKTIPPEVLAERVTEHLEYLAAQLKAAMRTNDAVQITDAVFLVAVSSRLAWPCKEMPLPLMEEMSRTVTQEEHDEGSSEYGVLSSANKEASKWLHIIEKKMPASIKTIPPEVLQERVTKHLQHLAAELKAAMRSNDAQKIRDGTYVLSVESSLAWPM